MVQDFTMANQKFFMTIYVGMTMVNLVWEHNNFVAKY